MLSLILFAVCIGLSSQQLPSHSQIEALVAAQFGQLDTNHDGILSLGEMDNVALAEDTDGDGKVSLQEFMAYTNGTMEQAKPMFDAFDNDKDGFLETNHMDAYLKLMDQNHDGEVNLNEYKHYQSKLIECIYGNHHMHGHATSCMIQ